jgi:hypothetical protein
MAKTFSFEEAQAPPTEEATIRAGVSGPMGATDADIDQEASATRAQLATTANPDDKQMLEQHLAATEANRAPKMPFSFEEASKPATTFSFDEARTAKQPLLADVQPSNAGAGRGRVNPSMAITPRDEQPLGDPMGTGAAEIMASAQPRDAGAGRGFVNPGDVPKREVGFAESAGRGWGRAGAETAKAMNLAAAAPVVVAEKLKNLITGSDSTSAQDAVFRNLVDPTQRAVDWYALKPDEKQGFLGKVGDALGAMAQDLPQMLAAGGATAPGALAQHAPTVARFVESIASKGFDAMRPIMVKAGTEKAQQVLDAGGTPQQAVNSAATAALLTGFQGMMPMSAEGSWWQRFLTGLPVGPVQGDAARVVQNAADPAALHRDFDPAEAAAGAVTNAVASTAMGHSAPGRAPDRIALGYDPMTGKRPTAAAVDAAFPAEPGTRPTQPGQAVPARDVAADITASSRPSAPAGPREGAARGRRGRGGRRDGPPRQHAGRGHRAAGAPGSRPPSRATTAPARPMAPSRPKHPHGQGCSAPSSRPRPKPGSRRRRCKQRSRRRPACRCRRCRTSSTAT